MHNNSVPKNALSIFGQLRHAHQVFSGRSGFFFRDLYAAIDKVVREGSYVACTQFQTGVAIAFSADFREKIECHAWLASTIKKKLQLNGTAGIL